MTLVAALVQSSDAKPGNLKWYAGSVTITGEQEPQSGWLVANGTSLLRAGKYAALFTEIGTAYGSADGTHFSLPDHTDGKNPLPLGVTNYPTRGTTGGEASHVLVSSEIPAHTHTYGSVHGYDPANQTLATDRGPDPRDTDFGPTNQNAAVHGTTGVAHENMPPALVVGAVLIKY